MDYTHAHTCPAFRKGASYKWKTANVQYENFTDLGRYIIDCHPHKCFDFRRALDYANKRFDPTKKRFGCSALATKTCHGDVLIGRNLDLTCSQYPCYITHVHYGKYATINFTYDEMHADTPCYDALLACGKIDDEYYNALPLVASDSMNSAGLYLEYNMRDYEHQFICMGTNPDVEPKVCSVCLPFLVASNCATVPQAIHYLKNHVNIYTLVDESVASGWNLCMMIGDAVGNFGLIEIANEEVKYLPFQHGQGNYYIYPEFNSTSRNQSGYGRLQFGLERIDTIQNDCDMAAIMEKIMWRNEILNIPFAYRDARGHIHFCEDASHSTPSLDWRSDNVRLLPVNQNGQYVDVNEDNEESIHVRKLKDGWSSYKAGEHSPENKRCFDLYNVYLERCDLVWVQSNEHFEDLQRGLIQYYTETGIVEKLKQYYAGNEKPLRDDGNIWTTSLSFSVNCTKKRLTVKFWEKPDLIMWYQW